MRAAAPLALLTLAVLLGDLAVVDARLGDAAVPPPPSWVQASPSPTPAASDDSPGETLDEQLARVTRVVEELRELSFPEPPLVEYVSPDVLRSDVEEQVAAYDEQAADLDQRMLVALGQLPAGTDLRDLLITTYGDQVAGYYDPETTELVVGTTSVDERVGRLDELTLAHELSHSLVDATIGLVDFEDFDEAEVDALAAAQALVEGDASAVMNVYVVEAMNAIDQLFLAREALALQETLLSFTELPYVIRRSLEFPYLDGAAFVESLRSRGGWAAVDAAYAAPPTTTLEILDPSQYGVVEVLEPAPFGDPGSGWEAVRTGQFGALDLEVLLAAPSGDELAGDGRADRYARGWRGGLLRQWSDGPQTAVAFHLAHADPSGLCEAMQRWARASLDAEIVTDRPAGTNLLLDGADRDLAVACDDGGLRVGIAPSQDTALAVIGA